MKEGLCTAVGVVGSAIAAAFGGWDQALVTLVIFMVIDYLSGLIVAGIFHNSRKTENGALESRAGWKGLCRKGVTLLFVLIAYRLDLALGVNYIRNAVIIGFMANELISITENAGLMGIPLPTGTATPLCPGSLFAVISGKIVPVLASLMKLSHPHPFLDAQKITKITEPSGRILLEIIKSSRSMIFVPSPRI